MSEQRHGGWDDLDAPAEQQYGGNPTYTPVTQINRGTARTRTVRRNAGDHFREFFYWFGSNGGFQAMPKTIAVIAAIVLAIWIIVNRNAIFSGILGFLSEIIPIALFFWLVWLCIRNVINPK